MATPNHSGLGGTLEQVELTRWLREAGPTIVHVEGFQRQLFSTELIEMWRIYDRKTGKSILVSAETAQSLGLIPSTTNHTKAQSTPDLFTPPQGSLF